MGKTRRKLYSRRQRGGVNCRKLLVAAALASVSATAAERPPIGHLVTDYIEQGTWEASQNLANGLLDYVSSSSDSTIKYVTDKYGSLYDYFTPSSDSGCKPLPPTSTVKTESQADQVLKSYLLRVGEIYEFTKKDTGEVKRVYILDHTNPGEWITDVEDITPSNWQEYTVTGPVANKKDFVGFDEDDDEEGGGRRRNRKRKTLRRKK